MFKILFGSLMNKDNWVPVDKNISLFFSKNRAYTEVEAYLSLRINLDNNCPKGLREYGRMWKWSRGKVERFFKQIDYKTGETLIVTRARQSRDKAVTPIGLIYKELDDNEKTKPRQSRDKAVTPASHNYKTSKTKTKKEESTLSFPKPKTTVKESKKINLLKNKIDGSNTKYSEAFEILWQLYPNNVGKKSAARHWNATIKSEDDIQRIGNALEKYKVHLMQETWKKPQNGSTWFNNWQDWETVEKDFRKSENGSLLQERTEGGFLIYEDGTVIDERTGKKI